MSERADVVRVETTIDDREGAEALARSVIENRLEVDFREQCWGFTAAFIDRVDEDEFRITINLLELGQYGFGRGFTGLQ